jgi:Ca2+-binding RTX toxin-like protein
VSIFIGSNAGETIEPGFVSPTVVVIGNPKTPGAGTDIILAGSGDDQVAGGGGNDLVSLGAGNDLYTWNSGDGNDLVDGGSGSDTLAFNGSAGAETIKLSSGILGTTRVSSSADNGSVTLTGVEHIVVSAGAGDDVVDASGLPAGHATLEIFGGLGNDLLIGSAGDDFFNGGDGNDTAQMGAGNDTFVWNPGDDNDVVEGQAGTDTLLFNGANIAEEINIQSNGQRALFTRNIATVTMDLNGVERIDFNALGGADVVRVHDLSGTDVKQVNVNLAATPGGSTGDGAVDQVIVDGTSGNDALQFTGSGASASVLGLAATTTVLNAEASDQLIVNGLAGNDVVSASVAQAGAPALVFEGGDGNDTALIEGSSDADTFAIAANGTRAHVDSGNLHLDVGTTESLVIHGGSGDDNFSAVGNLAALTSLTLDGGAGNDTILGGNGADLLIGGDGNDFIDGNQGNDVAQMGAGDDTFQWDPGDGSDVVEGGDGADTMLFNGANIAENMEVFANGQRALFTRNIGTITMDLNDVERIDVTARGGTDLVRVHDLTGTDVKEVNVDLAATPGTGSGDGAADQVVVEGTGGDDIIHAEANGASATVTGLAAVTNVANLEATDQLIVDGRGGNDTIIGGAGSQVLHGGDGDDVLIGGDGDDQMFGDAGNDRMVWNPGDDTDLMEGGDGTDTAEMNGGNGGESFTATANGTRVRFDRVNPAPFSLDIGTTEELVVNMNGGDDSFSATGNLSPLIHITVDGGAGNDTILGGNGADLLIGGDGNDFIDGNQGNDTAQMGAGDDTFQWDPGDGSDVIEGGDGGDTMLFNGANIAENMELSANGPRALFTRNIGTITMDLNDVERVDVTARGGADNIAVHDLTGTDVTHVNVDLAGTPGGSTGDGAADRIAVDATSGNDVVAVSGASGAASVTGLHADVNLSGAEAALDTLQVNLGGGNDVFDASGLAADVVQLTVVGGAGADAMIGSQGNDTFVWNPGDGNDLIEGQAGVDNLLFNGANIGESVELSANGSRALFTRDIAGITMDLNDVEHIDFNALGGVDNVAVNDLSGTDVKQVNVNLAATGGGGDGSADVVTVNATSGDDVAVISGGAGGISVQGLAAQISITGAEGGLDRLHVNGGAGDDVIEASGVAAGSIGLVLDGGEGNDVIIGSAGDDVLIGGPGDDVIIGNGGNDTIIAAPGADTVIQGFQAGAGAGDVIDLRGIAGAQDFAWVIAHASDVDGNAVLDLGGEHVTLENVSVASLHSDDFLLGS